MKNLNEIMKAVAVENKTIEAGYIFIDADHENFENVERIHFKQSEFTTWLSENGKLSFDYNDGEKEMTFEQYWMDGDVNNDLKEYAITHDLITL
jgi:hypothetical protein